MNSTSTPINAQLDSTPQSPLLSQSFVMENWLVIPELNRLQNKLTNQSRSVEPRLMHLLCYLAANELTVVGRDSLVEQLWPNVIVNENSLTRAVSELRKQLRGGCRENPIETIPKRGYRLVCKIESVSAPSIQASPMASPVHVTPNQAFIGNALQSVISKTQAPSALMAITLAALLAAIVSIDSVGSSDSEFDGLVRVPSVLVDEVLIKQPSYSGYAAGQLTLSSANIETNNNSTTRPVVSHDGGSYAYLSYDQNGSTVFVGTLNEMGDPCALYQTPEKLVNLAWSPVGQSLLFTEKTKLTTAALFSNNPFSNHQAESQLLVLDVASGKLQRLVEDDLPKNNHVINESSLT